MWSFASVFLKIYHLMAAESWFTLKFKVQIWPKQSADPKERGEKSNKKKADIGQSLLKF